MLPFSILKNKFAEYPVVPDIFGHTGYFWFYRKFLRGKSCSKVDGRSKNEIKWLIRAKKDALKIDLC